MEKSRVERINELAHKAKTEGRKKKSSSATGCGRNILPLSGRICARSSITPILWTITATSAR